MPTASTAQRAASRVRTDGSIGDSPGSLIVNAASLRSCFLHANSEVYEALTGKVHTAHKADSPEAKLARVSSAAVFASIFHPGRFADGALENVALDIGTELKSYDSRGAKLDLPVVRGRHRRRVLHVISRAREIGGHTRMLFHWVRNDRNSCHSVLVSNQGDVPVPTWLHEATQTGGGDLVAFPPRTPICAKASWMREMAGRCADLVVLHHDGSDVTPTIAFAQRGGPPVAVLNHADHQFWLGSSVADVVINLRTTGSKHTADRRFIPSNTVVPVPLVDSVRSVSRMDARRTLDIPENQIVMLSVGRPEKYRPCGPYDFVATAGKILDRAPHAHLFVVGESAEGVLPYLRCALHTRLHFVGSMDDPSIYRIAADLYLESFPFCSQTALLEAALSGLPIVPAYAPLSPLLVASDDAVMDILPNPKNEEEYIEKACLLAGELELRTVFGGTLRKRLLVDHVGDGWLGRLEKVYRVTDELVHRTQAIPTCPCTASEGDIGLSLCNVMADGRTNSGPTAANSSVALLRHRAYVAKYVGDYVTARRMAWRALVCDPHQGSSWRLLAAAALGKWSRSIRRILHLS